MADIHGFEVIPRMKEFEVKMNKISENDFRMTKACCVKVKRLDKKFGNVLKYVNQDSRRRFSVGFDRSNRIGDSSKDNKGEEMCDIQENIGSNFNEPLLLSTLHRKESSFSHDIYKAIDGQNMECHHFPSLTTGQYDTEGETVEDIQNCSFSSGTFYSARSEESSFSSNGTFVSVEEETLIQSDHFVSSDEDEEEKQIDLVPKIKIKEKLAVGILELNSDSISTSSSQTVEVDTHDDFDSLLDDGDKSVPQALTKQKWEQRRPYTKEEDENIVSYMKGNEMGGRQRGRRSWQVMEEKEVCPGRTWQSMKERWIKHIQRNIRKFNVDNQNQDN